MQMKRQMPLRPENMLRNPGDDLILCFEDFVDRCRRDCYHGRVWGTHLGYLLLKSLTDQCNYRGMQLLASSSQLDLDLAREVKANKKGISKYIGHKSKAG